eukprot:s4522_g7.t1
MQHLEFTAPAGVSPFPHSSVLDILPNAIAMPSAAAKGAHVLFVDCRTAFYSTTRQSLTGHETGQTAAFLQFAEDIYPDAAGRLRSLQTAGPGLLQRNDVPLPVRRVICSMLDSTWSASKEARGTAFLIREVAPHRARPLRMWNSYKAHQHLAAVLEIARTAICEFTAELHQIGISLNTDAGKTDLVPIFQWPGSQQARQTWLCAYGAQLPVPLPTGGQIFLTMSDGYTHLGSVISACGSDLPDISRRAALAREMIGPLRRLCRNSELSTVWWWATPTPEATQVDALPACAPWQGPLLHCFLRFSVPPRIIDHGI